MKSNAEFRISARVRSDLPILDAGCGFTRGGDGFFLFDMALSYTDTVVSLSSCLVPRRDEGRAP